VLLYATITNTRVAVLAMGLGFSPVYGDDGPIRARLVHSTLNFGTDISPTKFDNSISENPVGFARADQQTEGAVLYVWRSLLIHPQSTFYRADRREHQIIIANTSGFAGRCHLRVTSPNAVDVTALLEFEE